MSLRSVDAVVSDAQCTSDADIRVHLVHTLPPSPPTLLWPPVRSLPPAVYPSLPVSCAPPSHTSRIALVGPSSANKCRHWSSNCLARGQLLRLPSAPPEYSFQSTTAVCTDETTGPCICTRYSFQDNWALDTVFSPRRQSARSQQLAVEPA